MLCIYNTLVCFNNNNKKGWHYKDYAATRILKNSLILDSQNYCERSTDSVQLSHAQFPSH